MVSIINTNDKAEQTPPFCGIIMPIAAMPNYEKTHWDRVRTILDEAITDAGFSPRLVSESENIGVIHARIVQNLFDDTIVVCDVSGKNANVMFELGLRLAFDKPTIVIKDQETDYSFDTSPIEHINYRADLRFDDVRAFQEKLAVAIKATVAKKEQDPGYSPFLGHFHRVKVTSLETTEVSSDQFIVEQIQGLQKEVGRLANRMTEMADIAENQMLRNSASHIDPLTGEAIRDALLTLREEVKNPFVKRQEHPPMSLTPAPKRTTKFI